VLKLDFLMDMTVDVAVKVIGPGPFGTRQMFEVLGGEFKGPRLAGRVLRSGGDWMLMGNDRIGRLDVRFMLETSDAALIYMQFFGVLEVNDRVVAAASGTREGDFEDAYFVTQPRFETGDARYAWLNRCVGLSEGAVHRGKVSYRVFRAVKG
jgi:hypothetical protein